MFIAVIVVIILIALDPNRPISTPQQEGDSEKSPVADEPEATTGTPQTEQFVEVPYEAPEIISKALALKMVVLSKEDKESVQVRDREIDYADTNKEDWFDKYFNVAIIEGWFTPQEQKLNPLDALTYSEAEIIANYFSLDLESEGIKVKGKEKTAIPYEEWITIYKSLIAKLEVKDVLEVADLIVFATPTLSNTLPGWTMATDHGQYSFEGIAMDSCINKEVSFFTRGNEVLYIQEIVQENPILTNAYIVNLDAGKRVVEVFMGGVTRNIPLDPSLNNKDQANFIGDVQLLANMVINLKEKTNISQGVVKKISANEIEVEGLGKRKLSEHVKFYNTVDQLRFTDYASVVVGYDTASLILENDLVEAVIVKNKVKIETIRVVLNDTSYQNLYHENVIASAPQPFSSVQNTIVEALDAKDTFDVSKMNLEIGERVTLVPEKGGKIQIKSISRGSGVYSPEYRGNIEIERVDEGYIVINEVNLEDYLYGVIPSEMPTSYGLEAAKVQAVCARSYAYTQVYANRFCDYGAHIDDSTTSQVYNNTPETTLSIQAVKDTKGQLLSFEGNIISTNFFSTSCGVTADSGDVWSNYSTKEFPTTSTDYLRSHYQRDKNTETVELSDEDKFRAFILNKKLPSFDADFAWYRWSTTITADQIEATFNKSIGARYKVQPKLIKTLDENNIFRSRPIEDIGEILDIKVYSRGKSGIITEMVITTAKGVYKIGTEYNIRLLIAPINYVEGGKSVIITRNDGKTSSDLALMPSAFYVIDKTYDSKGLLATVTFNGGGYGHGVGMSQNGAKAMVDLGYKYEDILKHYYAGTEIMKVD